MINKVYKNVVIQNRYDADKVLERDLISRENLSDGEKNLKHKLVKVITGPRRTGKSTFALLLLRNKKFCYLNFDDEKLMKCKDTDEITEAIFEVYGGKLEYLVFDEIQNLKDWEIYVNKLQRKGYNLIITGSNAKLLSRELGTALTGRYIPIEMLPFNYREFLTAHQFDYSATDINIPERRGELMNYLNSYLSGGGYPEIILQDVDSRSYLSTLFDSVMLKDVVKRYNIRYSQSLYDLAIYLLTNFGLEYSFNSLRKSIGFNSTNTVQNYIKYLEETYLFFSLERFSFSKKNLIRAPRKIYIADNGFIPAVASLHSTNIGRLLENAVFIELLRKKYKPNLELYYHKTGNGKEIDFVLKKSNKVVALIQVCYDISDLATNERECRALFEAAGELKCDNLILLANNETTTIKYKTRTIRIISILDFFLGISKYI